MAKSLMIKHARSRCYARSLDSICNYPCLLGVPKLLVSIDDDNATYHLKGLLSEQECESLAQAAKAVVKVEIGISNNAEWILDSDARLAKSTILRLATLLRIPGSSGIFPNLTHIRILRPKTLDILPLFISPGVTGLDLERWDNAQKGGDGPGSRDQDLVYFLKTLAHRTGRNLKRLTLSRTIASPDIIHCIPRFSSLTFLELVDVLPSEQAGADVLQLVFEAVSSLASLVGLKFHCSETDIAIKSSPAPPRPLTLGDVTLYLTGPVYEALSQYICLTVTGSATIGLVFRDGYDNDDQRRPEVAQFSNFFFPFIPRSPLIFLALGSCDPNGFPSKARLPVDHLKAILHKPTLFDLSLTGWILVRDGVVQALKNPSPAPSLRKPNQMRKLYFSYDCSWDGFSVQDLALISSTYPCLTELTGPFRLGVPSATGWDVGVLGGSSLLAELWVYERGPEENGEELGVRDNIEVVRYLKKVFPKLERLECPPNATDKVWSDRWELVKELFDAVAGPRQ